MLDIFRGERYLKGVGATFIRSSNLCEDTVDQLTNMTVFVRVAATRSFSLAARQLDISQATASKQVQMLESWFGARLLDRTTRHVELSAVGKVFYDECTRILEDVESARRLSKPDNTVHGSVHIAAPVALGSKHLGPLSVAFMQEHPQVALHVTLVDRTVDVIDEGFDLTLRVMRNAPNNTDERNGVTVRPIMPMPYVACAAPSYLNSIRAPETPAALATHACLTDSRDLGNTWFFSGPGGDYEVLIDGRFRCDNGLFRREAALAGGGIALLPEMLVADDIADHRLIRILPEFQPKASYLQAAYPSARAGQPKIRALLDFLVAGLPGGL